MVKVVESWVHFTDCIQFCSTCKPCASTRRYFTLILLQMLWHIPVGFLHLWLVPNKQENSCWEHELKVPIQCLDAHGAHSERGVCFNWPRAPGGCCSLCCCLASHRKMLTRSSRGTSFRRLRLRRCERAVVTIRGRWWMGIRRRGVWSTYSDQTHTCLCALVATLFVFFDWVLRLD